MLPVFPLSSAAELSVLGSGLALVIAPEVDDQALVEPEAADGENWAALPKTEADTVPPVLGPELTADEAADEVGAEEVTSSMTDDTTAEDDDGGGGGGAEDDVGGG